MDVLYLRQEFLDDSAECLVNSVVIDACEMVVNLDFLVLVRDSEFADETTHVLRYFVEHVKLLVILLEQIRVHLMDEYLKRDVGVDFVSHLDDFVQFITGSVFIWLVGIDHINQRTASPERVDVLLTLLIEFFGSRKVKNLELNVGVVIGLYNKRLGSLNQLTEWLHVLGGHQEESLMRTHLLEDDLLDASFA